MKQCPYCGKEYPDEATTCSLDQQPLKPVVDGRPLAASDLVLYSPLTPAECASKLADAIDREGFWGFSSAMLFGSKPVTGRVTESSIRLRKRIQYRNSFQNIFSGTMTPANPGTIISGDFGMYPFVKIFMFIWCGGVVLIGGTIFLTALGGAFRQSGKSDGTLVGLLVPPGMLVCGLAILHFGKFLARNESKFISDFLIHTLNARKIATEPGK